MSQHLKCHSGFAAFVGMIIVQVGISTADVKQDVLGLTNGSRAKMVWVRCASNASDFNEHPSRLYNYGTKTSLMCFDTDEGTERVLDAGPSQHRNPVITRSGQYAIWNDNVNNRSRIISWNGSGVSTLLSGASTAYFVLCCQWDQATGKEYLYTTIPLYTGTGGNGPASNQETAFFRKVYRSELTNGTATTPQLILDINDGDAWRLPLLVSGDGKLASISNWPNIFIWDFSDPEYGFNGINTGDGLACWPSIAPDVSGRFFHFNDAHDALHMFDIFSTTDASKIRYVDVASKMPGNTFNTPDACGPRYSNHVDFISASYPLQGDFDAVSYNTGKFCIGKFNSTYTQMTFVQVSNPVSARDRIGDLWVASGEGPNKTGVITSKDNGTLAPRPITIRQSQTAVAITAQNLTAMRVELLTIRGQVLASVTIPGGASRSLATFAHPIGKYLLKCTSESQTFTQEIVLCK